MLDELGNYIQTGGQYLIDEAPVMRRLAETAGRPGAFLTPEKAADLPLACLNRASEEIKASRVRFARYQGAVTGLGGLFTLAADIPLLLGTSLKVIQEMALVYGYDPRIPSERAFAVYCLQFSSSDIVGKRAILNRLSSWETGERMRESVSLLEGWREVIMNYGDQWGWKKLFQMVPVAGAIFGAWINQSAVEEVAEAARMMYRKRRVLAKLERMGGGIEAGRSSMKGAVPHGPAAFPAPCTGISPPSQKRCGSIRGLAASGGSKGRGGDWFERKNGMLHPFQGNRPCPGRREGEPIQCALIDRHGC